MPVLAEPAVPFQSLGCLHSRCLIVSHFQSGFGTGFLALPQSDFVSGCSGSLKNSGANILQEMNRHVFGSGIAVQFLDPMGIGRAYGGESILILFPEDEGVVPVFVNPTVDALFQLLEIQNSTDLILLVAGEINLE